MAGSHTEKFDTEFDQERAWILEQIAKKDLELAEAINEEEYEDSGGGIECGCCFSTYPFVRHLLSARSISADRLGFLLG